MSALPTIYLLFGKLAFLVGLLWSFWGAGRLLTRALTFFAPGDVATAAPTVLVGAAFVIAVSGYMLSVGRAGPWAMAAVLGVFALAALCVRPAPDILQAIRRPGAPLLMLAMLVVMITAFYVWLPPSFNGGDDSPGYYVFVREISVLGDLSPQPFSERRLYTLGGHFPLSALSDYLFGPEGMSIIDPGLGLALVGIFLISLILRGAARVSVAALILALLAGQLAIGSPIKNTIPVMLPFAFLLVMSVTVLARNAAKADPVDAAGFGLLAAAALSFRVTILPYVAMLGLIFVLLQDTRRRKLDVAVIAGISFLLAVLPFALLMRRSSGTFLFPVLGPGVHASAFQDAGFASGTLLHRAMHSLSVVLLDIRTLAAASLVVLHWAIDRDLNRLTRAASVLVGFILASVVVAFSTEGVAFYRYTFPATAALAAALLVTTPWPGRMPAGLSQISIPPNIRAPVAVATLVTIIVTMAIVTNAGRLNGFSASISDRIQARYAFIRQSEDEESAFESAARTIPRDARVLVFLPRAYLLPHGRFQIVVNDQPGRAGPPPFWPRPSSSAEVLSYLQSQGIDFVLVPGGKSLPPACSVDTPSSQWIGKLVESSCEFAMAVVSEPLSSRVVHEDDFIRLIDLRPIPKGARGLRATEAPHGRPSLSPFGVRSRPP